MTGFSVVRQRPNLKLGIKSGFSVACQRSDLYTRIQFRILGAGHTDEMTLIIQIYYTIFLHENQHKTKMFFGAFETKK